MVKSLQNFLNLAGQLRDPSDITKLLQFLAETAGADGVTFWRLAPGAILTDTAKSGRFFPVASWCRFTDVLPWYVLPVDSLTGKAWLERDRSPFCHVPDVDEAKWIPEESRKLLLEHWKMNSCASIPILSPEDPASGVTFYRRDREIPINSLRKIIPAVRQLPSIYEWARDRQALELLARLNDLMHPPNRGASERGPETLTEARARLDRVCGLVEEYFAATEVSVLLLDGSEERESFHVQAQHWTWPSPPYTKTYTPGQGLTGWALAHCKPICILDLVRFEEDREWIQKNYEDLAWKDLLVIKEQARRKFQLPLDCPDRDLPIVSFVSVPVVHGRLLGVLRCCGRNSSPWTFDENDARMLALAASFIGGWWSDLLDFVSLQKDSDQLKGLVGSVTSLHRKAGELLVNESKDSAVLLEATLEKAMASITGVDHGSLRLVNEEQSELYYKAWKGSLWMSGGSKRVSERTRRTFPLGKDGMSLGAGVVREAKAKFVNDPNRDPLDAPVRGVGKRVYVPIRGGGGVLGVLELGRENGDDFSERDAVVAETFAAQIGLYVHLDNQLQGRARAQKNLRDQQEEQMLTFENLRHQIFGPVGTAAMALERILLRPELPDDIRRDLSHARGDALKASVMVRSLELFSALASNRKPRVKPERLTESWLKHRLNELLKHQSVSAPAAQRLEFFLRTEEMDFLRFNPVFCDLNLFEHAVSNLLENARKYSAKGTRIIVFCGSMDHGQMYFIAVRNAGLKIAPTDVAKMTERGWRSDEAWSVVAEGNGIGLYVVDAIMKAHGGRVQISPTNSLGVNDVRLLFPIGGFRG